MGCAALFLCEGETAGKTKWRATLPRDPPIDPTVKDRGAY
ncbi:hypothetical protein Z947_2663 [Sulfitobacter geojensis]|nr:hypothetical protein Z947_2663 [Sulfitobacter geojensis]